METAADITARLDKYGRKFDSSKFLPVFDRAGRWKNRNAGRKKAAPPAADTPPPDQAPQPAPALETPSAAADASAPAPDLSGIAAAARAPSAAAVTGPGEAFDLETLDGSATAETVIGAIQVALVLIGEDEGILSDTEKRLLRPPLERVLSKYGVGANSLPPEADLALVLATLVISRLQKPKTATFFAKAKAWCVNLWFRGKGEVLRREVAKAVS